MPRLNPVDPASATGKTKDLLDAAQSPAALQAYLGLSGALAQAKRSNRVQEQIALALALANACHYCLAAHTQIAGMAGLSDGDHGHPTRRPSSRSSWAWSAATSRTTT